MSNLKTIPEILNRLGLDDDTSILLNIRKIGLEVFTEFPIDLEVFRQFPGRSDWETSEHQLESNYYLVDINGKITVLPWSQRISESITVKQPLNSIVCIERTLYTGYLNQEKLEPFYIKVYTFPKESENWPVYLSELFKEYEYSTSLDKYIEIDDVEPYLVGNGTILWTDDKWLPSDFRQDWNFYRSGRVVLTEDDFPFMGESWRIAGVLTCE